MISHPRKNGKKDVIIRVDIETERSRIFSGYLYRQSQQTQPYLFTNISLKFSFAKKMFCGHLSTVGSNVLP